SLQADPNSTGILIQEKHKSVNTIAAISDWATIQYYDVPDTHLAITIQNNSKILAMFSSPYLLVIADDFGPNEALIFYIALNIGTGTKRDTRIEYTELGNDLASARHIGGNMFILCETENLPAGTYNVTVSWTSKSTVTNPVGINQLQLSSMFVKPQRTLWVQEIKG
ncbi:MAG: hypothetical protein ACXABF_16330, partial [Candidatus Thorarchaeota archaeon]